MRRLKERLRLSTSETRPLDPIQDEVGAFRVIYLAKLADAVYVLHCFHKKTQQTSEKDIKLAQKRFKDLMKDRP